MSKDSKSSLRYNKYTYFRFRLFFFFVELSESCYQEGLLPLSVVTQSYLPFSAQPVTHSSHFQGIMNE